MSEDRIESLLEDLVSGQRTVIQLLNVIGNQLNKIDTMMLKITNYIESKNRGGDKMVDEPKLETEIETVKDLEEPIEKLRKRMNVKPEKFEGVVVINSLDLKELGIKWIKDYITRFGITEKELKDKEGDSWGFTTSEAPMAVIFTLMNIFNIKEEDLKDEQKPTTR